MGAFFCYLPLYDFCVTKGFIAVDKDSVSGVQTADDFVMLGILSAQLDGGASGTMTFFINLHDPLSACLCIEVATRDDKTTFRFSQFYLQS